MAIAIGDRLPEATFRVMGPDGIKAMTTGEVFGGKKVVLFAVPGAFTPTCHLKHLPGFIESADEFKKNGIDTVACVAVNDPFVLGAWAETSGGKGKVLFLSDGNAEFTKKIGMDFDGSGVGLGTRSKRYAALVEDGVVKALNVEDSPGVAVESTAAKTPRASVAVRRRPCRFSGARGGTAPCPRARVRRRARSRHGRHGL